MTAIPATMKAIEIAGYGGPEVLKPAQRPVPQPAAGEVLVKVGAAGVNRPDVAQRQGNYPPPPGITDIPGLDIAGEIVALGEGVTGWKVGDKVCALVAGGGYSEYCVAPAPQCLPVPKGLDVTEAAAIPETFFTVWDHLVDGVGLKKGDILLVHGASSGIGTSAILLGKALGARVFGTAGNEKKTKAIEALGCEKGINYRTEDFVDVVKKATGGHGADVILDMVAGDYIPRDIELLAFGGRLSVVATLGGNSVDKLPIVQVLMKRLTITGRTLRRQPIAYKGAIADGLRKTLWPAFESGKIKPVIDCVLPIDQAGEAHRRMEESNHVGKIVLKV
jgi:putative PIG3 family NAD(P)H quinone oxidoreductase